MPEGEDSRNLSARAVCVLLVVVVFVRVDAMPFAALGVALLSAAAVVLPLVTLVVVSVVLLLAAGLSVWSRRRSRIFKKGVPRDGGLANVVVPVSVRVPSAVLAVVFRAAPVGSVVLVAAVLLDVVLLPAAVTGVVLLAAVAVVMLVVDAAVVVLVLLPAAVVVVALRAAASYVVSCGRTMWFRLQGRR